ncbi:Serine/threonine-protein kinase HT1 [Leucoagaricus sp. SymC.cos]|nr:Serine/threonine-protein kinase HT1 [Leucoagaricus sp. SymC.cos]
MGGAATATRAERAHIGSIDNEYAIVVLAEGDTGVKEADGDFVAVGGDSQAMAVELVVEVASAWEMASQTPVDNPPNVPDPFAPLQQLVSRIDSESRALEIIDKARELNTEERQLLVDVLSTTLNKSKILSQRHAHAWSALIKIASSAHIFARNRTVRFEYMVTGSEASAHVKVVRQTQDRTSVACYRKLVEWAHLSHPNILPLYASFLESEDHPSFVSPSKSTVKICDHAWSLASDQRLPLILDVINGLCHLHQLNIVHGGLGPGTVLVSDEGRALITDLDVPSEEEDSNAPLIRYSAPELSLKDDSRPTKASDVWTFGCLGHEVLLSGKVPFCQFSNDFRAISAIGRGDKPARPGQDGRGGSAIGDAIWDLLMRCWEYEVTDRSPSSKIQEMLSYICTEDRRPEPMSIIEPEAIKPPATNLELAQAVLSQILGSHEPASLQVPKHLRDTLSRLVHDSEALDAVKVAAKKLNHDDTQTLVDLIELVVKDLPHLPASNLTGQLLCDIMDSTHIVPQHYRASGVEYDPTRLVSEFRKGKLYEGRVLKVRVCIADSDLTPDIIPDLALWANTSHPNILPFHGVFHENLMEPPQFCVVLPYLRNGTLEDYAPTLPQKSRMLLISDVVNGLAYLQDIVDWSTHNNLTGKGVVISDEGRALIVSSSSVGGVLYSFGCLSYQVLSRKLPYYQVSDKRVKSTVRRGGEPLIRPDRTDAEMDEIDDKAWEFIMKCCAHKPEDRPDWSQIQEMLANMEIEEDRRPPATPLPIPEIQALRSRPEIDVDRAETVLNQAEVLHGPLSELIESHTKDVVTAVAEFERDEIQTIVNFLDQALKERLTITEERNRVLAILSMITSSTLIFPQRYELSGIKHGPRKYLAQGGYGIVYQGADPAICIKLMRSFDTGISTAWAKEVILWAHSSHLNVLPFLGMFLDSQGNPPQICLVSPFMKNGNLRNYASRLPQKSRLPLILDVVNGLRYLHDLGVVHGDLKGENVLISNEGRGLITDFGISHINTTTAATGSLFLTTLRFSAPEIAHGDRTPTKKLDIWSLGCLLYELLSRNPPYYQYKTDVQIFSALNRKEISKRPSSTDLDDDIEEDYDAIDDQAWSLIVKCCAHEPAARPDIANVQELVVDMKIHDYRPAVKDAPGADILKSRVNPKINLTRVEELFDQVKEKLASRAKNEPTGT